MLNRAQLDLIPDDLLKPGRRSGAARLIRWLHARGWAMTLHELDTERRTRGLVK